MWWDRAMSKQGKRDMVGVGVVFMYLHTTRLLQVVGWAMVARGELGFVMSQQSFEADVLSARPYVACIWALFVCTLVPPFIFGWALARKKRKDDEAALLHASATEDESGTGVVTNASVSEPPIPMEPLVSQGSHGAGMNGHASGAPPLNLRRTGRI
eukprot:m.63277 g.63277  ORF g.63277 m.63277 type:complete len:156 (+) comp8145_c0_seq1:1727-2194(+)